MPCALQLCWIQMDFKIHKRSIINKSSLAVWCLRYWLEVNLDVPHCVFMFSWIFCFLLGVLMLKCMLSVTNHFRFQNWRLDSDLNWYRKWFHAGLYPGFLISLLCMCQTEGCRQEKYSKCYLLYPMLNPFVVELWPNLKNQKQWQLLAVNHLAHDLAVNEEQG